MNRRQKKKFVKKLGHKRYDAYRHESVVRYAYQYAYNNGVDLYSNTLLHIMWSRNGKRVLHLEIFHNLVPVNSSCNKPDITKVKEFVISTSPKPMQIPGSLIEERMGCYEQIMNDIKC